MRRGAERMAATKLAVTCGENSGPQGRRRNGAVRGGRRPPLKPSFGRFALRADACSGQKSCREKMAMRERRKICHYAPIPAGRFVKDVASLRKLKIR